MPATCSAATASCSTTRSPGTWPTWKRSTPSRAPRPCRRSSSAARSPASGPSRRFWLLGLLQAAQGSFYLGFGSGTVGPGLALDALARLELLVDQEKVLDLQPVEPGQVMEVTQVFLTRVARGHAKDLVVAAILVGHPEHADRAAADQAAGERGL